MIACISTVKKGAMPQFTVQVYKSLRHNGIAACLYLPESEDISLDGVSSNELQLFKLLETAKKKKQIASEIASKIITSHIDEVWFCDETYTSLNIAEKISGKVKYKFFVHDAKPHLYSHDFKRTIRFIYFSVLRKRIFKNAEHIVLMSNSTKSTFTKYYPECANKLQVLLLGAHIPDIDGIMPIELQGINDFYMFFGTIEKYKNVYGLLRAFYEYHGSRKLVVAGNGALSEDEIELIKKLNDKVIIINRFIKDEELVYLFQHSRCVVLPYIEASQSGVLAMAYHFGNPVIVSNLPGLTEFVENHSNGYIYTEQNELVDALNFFDNNTDYENMRMMARKYSDEKLNFDNNIIKIV